VKNIIKDKEPHIALIDMKMPEMNGVELLSYIEDKKINMFNIVISGYSDFEYAKQAIKSNALDYILKPVNGEELNKILIKALDKIKEINNKKIDKINKNIKLNISIPTLKEKFYMSVIEDGYNEIYNNNINNYNETVKMKDYFRIVLIKLNNYNSILKRMFSNDKSLMYFAVTNIINEISLHNIRCFSFRNQKVDREIIIIMNKQNSDDFNISNVKSVCVNIYYKLYEIFKIKSIISISNYSGNISSLQKIYMEAKKNLDEVNLINPEIVNFKKELNKNKTNLSILSNFNLIKTTFDNKLKIEFLNVFITFFENIEKRGYFSFFESYKIIDEINFILKEIVCLDKSIIECKKEFSKEFIDIDNQDFGDFNSYCNFIYGILSDFYDEFSAINNVKEFSIKDIKEFIEKNYFKDIKISIFTKKYFLSREYLMKLFKQEFGYSIYEYVKFVRLNKAKELLCDLNIKISVISKMVGYNDQNYFSKAFKGFYGVSPSEYRIKLGLYKQT
jgi:two-component system response regulator YesN